MAHRRTQIRNAVIAAITGLATTGDSVFPLGGWVLADGQLPALVVGTPIEESEDDLDEMGGVEGFSLAVPVEVKIKTTADVLANLDAICLEVEAAMQADSVLGSYLVSMQLNTTTSEIDNEGEQSIGVAEMEFVVTYQVNKNEPETIL